MFAGRNAIEAMVVKTPCKDRMLSCNDYMDCVGASCTCPSNARSLIQLVLAMWVHAIVVHTQLYYASLCFRAAMSHPMFAGWHSKCSWCYYPCNGVNRTYRLYHILVCGAYMKPCIMMPPSQHTYTMPHFKHGRVHT